MLGKVVSVRWIDTNSADDLSENDSLKLEPAEAVSIGWLIVDTEDKVTIVGTIFKDGMRREVICFPRVVIKEIHLVGECPDR